jgi:hypothetical protein
MGNKVIKIEFRNAKLFVKDTKTKDFVLTTGGEYMKRKDRPNTNFVEPITVNQVSNMLHVMLGERPVPSFRYVPYSKVDEIFDIANNGYLKITTPTQTVERDDVTITNFMPEITTLNKAVWDSFSKPPSIEWFKVEKYFGDELFNEFIKLFKKLIGYNPQDKPFIYYQNKLPSYNDISPVVEFLLKHKKKPILNFLTKGGTFDFSEITKSGRIGETVIKGVTDAYFLSGIIYITVPEEMLDRFQFNTANILDGGLATITKIFDEDDFFESDTLGFTRIKNISTQTH